MNPPTEPELPHLVFATRNRHKTAQIALALAGKFQVSDLTHPDCAELPEVEETGVTFQENAVLKAVTISALLGPEVLVLADDSGLSVNALDGAPGVYSARYAGPGATDQLNNAKLLAALGEIGAMHPATRGAAYHCVLALARGGQVLHTTEGTVTGTLLEAGRGTVGFGYDPLFVPSGSATGHTFAELDDAEKLTFSHRGKALQAMLAWLDAADLT